MKKVILLIIIFALPLSFCGKGGAGKSGGSSGSGASIDGKAFKPKKSLAYKNAKHKVYVMYLFNHSDVKCEDILKSSRRIKSGEISMRISVQEGGKYPAIGIGAWTQMGFGGDIKIKITKTPANKGDKLVMNVDGSFTPKRFKYKDKKIELDGDFTADFCGEKK